MAQSTSPSLVRFPDILDFWKEQITSKKPSVELNSKEVNADFGLAIQTTSPPLASITIFDPNDVKLTNTNNHVGSKRPKKGKSIELSASPQVFLGLRGDGHVGHSGFGINVKAGAQAGIEATTLLKFGSGLKVDIRKALTTGKAFGLNLSVDNKNNTTTIKAGGVASPLIGSGLNLDVSFNPDKLNKDITGEIDEFRKDPITKIKKLSHSYLTLSLGNDFYFLNPKDKLNNQTFPIPEHPYPKTSHAIKANQNRTQRITQNQESSVVLENPISPSVNYSNKTKANNSLNNDNDPKVTLPNENTPLLDDQKKDSNRQTFIGKVFSALSYSLSSFKEAIKKLKTPAPTFVVRGYQKLSELFNKNNFNNQK